MAQSAGATRPLLLLDGHPFGRRAAAEAGISGKRLYRLLRDGLLRQPFRGVYLDALAPDDLQTRAAAVALVLPPRGVVTRRSAAWLYGIDTCTPAQRGSPPPLECLVPTTVTPPRHSGLVSYAAPLHLYETTVVCGVPVTTTTRTALDLARYLPPHMGLAVVDAMLHDGLVDQNVLRGEVTRFTGGRWIERARRTVELSEPLTESYGESWLRLRVIDAGFPRPTPQVVIRDTGGQFVARVDLADVQRRLVIEYDGQEHHSDAADIAHDESRRADLCQLGWRVLVATRNNVLGRSMHLEEALGEAYAMPLAIRRRTW